MDTILPLENNLLLGALPAASRDKLRPVMRVVEYKVSERIYDSGTSPDVIFPLDGIVSAVQDLADGSMIEVDMIGAEGMAGMSGILGVPKSPHTGLIQGRGLFALCGTREMREMLESDAAVRDIVLRWVHVSMAHMAQTAVCNRVHEVEQRLAHWLLLNHDRAAVDEISVTQEFLGLMLGARRATINAAMRNLTNSGSIEHRRGRVRVLDRKLLEEQSCECYAASVEQYETAFGFMPRAKGRVTPVD